MSNKIHPTAIIEGAVELGDNNEIGPYTVIRGPVSIGDGNWIGPHVTIGMPGQDTRNPRYDCTQARIRIGHHNIIREYTGIHKPCYRDITSIGNNVFLMQSVNINHDAIIHDDVVITPMVALAGICTILNGANLALGCAVHQYGVIGHYSIVAMGAVVTKNVRPFSRYIPDKPVSVNEYAVQKFGFDDLADEIAAYVLEQARPTTPRLLSLVEEFERLSDESSRPVY
jgi:UDP-N-acetylglucosamine acyltransferase